MNARTGSLMLAAGTPAGVALSLYADVPAAALVAWALAMEGAVVLAKIEQSFILVRNAAFVCALTELAVLTDTFEDATTWVRFAGIVVLLTGAASAYRTAAGDGFRADAAGRISTLTYLTVIPLALVTALLEAGTGPGWTPTVARALEVATMAATVWFAAFAVTARDGQAEIGRGTHARVVIDLARFNARLRAGSAGKAG